MFSHSKGQAGLPYSSWFAARERKPRRVVAHPRVAGVHRHGGIGSDRHPAVRASAPHRPRLPWISADRVEEFTVIEHLRPNAPVHQIADVLDKLSVQVGRDRGTRLACINADSHPAVRGIGGLGGGAGYQERCCQDHCQRTFHSAPSSMKLSGVVKLPRALTLPCALKARAGPAYGDAPNASHLPVGVLPCRKDWSTISTVFGIC